MRPGKLVCLYHCLFTCFLFVCFVGENPELTLIIQMFYSNSEDAEKNWHPLYSVSETRKMSCVFKHEQVTLAGIQDVIRNRFNFILEERVKFSEQNSENLMKIG